LELWLQAAKRKDIYDRIDALRMARMPWAEVDVVRSEVAMYQSMLRRLGEGGSSGSTVKDWTAFTGGKTEG